MTDFDPPIDFLTSQLLSIRPGTLSIGFVETFKVNGKLLRDIAFFTQRKDRIDMSPYGSPKEVRALVVSIVKTLNESKINAYALTPDTVCVTIPPVSGEQRDEMAVHIRSLGEQAKVSIRSIRKKIRTKHDVPDLQKAVDMANDTVEQLVASKIKSLFALTNILTIPEPTAELPRLDIV